VAVLHCLCLFTGSRKVKAGALANQVASCGSDKGKVSESTSSTTKEVEMLIDKYSADQTLHQGVVRLCALGVKKTSSTIFSSAAKNTQLVD
jgi:hypothetical protein